MKSKFLFIVITTLLVVIIFNILIKKQTKKLYCIRKIQVQIANFKKAAFRLGVIHIDEEQKYIDSIKNDIYNQCLKSS